jgi:opacity protein-like surface antigen
MSRPVILLAVACCLLPAVTSHAQSWKESPFHRQGFYAGLSGTYAFDQGLSNYLEDAFTEMNDAWNARRGVVCTAPCQLLPVEVAPIRSNNVTSGDAIGINARLGYRLRPWFAMEFQVEYVPPMETSVELKNKLLGTVVLPSGDIDVAKSFVVEEMNSTHEMTTAMLNARIFFPTGRIQPYLLGGAGIVYSQTTGEFATYCSLDVQCRPAGFNLKVTNPNPPPARVTIDTLYPVDVGSGALESGMDFGFRAGGGIDFYLNEHFVLNWEATAVIPTGKLEMLNYYSFAWGVQYRF